MLSGENTLIITEYLDRFPIILFSVLQHTVGGGEVVPAAFDDLQAGEHYTAGVEITYYES